MASQLVSFSGVRVDVSKRICRFKWRTWIFSLASGQWKNLWECGSHIHWSDRPENCGCVDGSPLVILAHTISQLKRGVTGRQKRISVRKDTKHGKPLDFDQALLRPSLPLQGFGHYLHLWVQLWWVGEQSTNLPPHPPPRIFKRKRWIHFPERI